MIPTSQHQSELYFIIKYILFDLLASGCYLESFIVRVERGNDTPMVLRLVLLSSERYRNLLEVVVFHHLA